MESLKAEAEVILEDVQPRASQSRAAAAPLTDPIILSVQAKLNVTLKGEHLKKMAESVTLMSRGPCHFKFSTKMMGIFKFRYCVYLLGTCMVRNTGRSFITMLKGLC